MADFGEIASNQPKESFYLPPGIIMPYGGTATTAPSGWLFCNGASHGTATYPSLFAVIGTYYGGGGGSFLVPDLRRRFVLGFDNTASGTASVNKTGGDWDHVHSGPAHTHSLSAHTHGIGNHNHGMNNHHHGLPGLSITANSSNAFSWQNFPSGNNSRYINAASALSVSYTPSAATGGPSNNTTEDGGSGNTGAPSSDVTGAASYGGNTTGAANPPYIVFKYIIKT